DGRVWPAVSAGPSPGRGGGALRAGQPQLPAQLLGRPRRAAREPLRECPQGRPADCGIAKGPEAARPAEGYARGLGHGVRPHAGRLPTVSAAPLPPRSVPHRRTHAAPLTETT